MNGYKDRQQDDLGNISFFQNKESRLMNNIWSFKLTENHTENTVVITLKKEQ
jgi:hypothetical protein